MKILKKTILLSLTLLLLLTNDLSAQYNQTIKGKVIDLNTGSPLIGANIILLDSTEVTGTISDKEGNFNITNVPVGRQSIKVSYVGYNTSTIKNLYLLSGKELVLDIKLEEKIFEGEEIVIKAFNRKDRHK